MVLIRMGGPREQGAALPTRRVGLDLAGLVALRRAALAAGLPDLPADVVHDPDDPGPDALVAEAASRLRRAGVLDEAGHPVPAVAANLAAVAAAPRRLRVQLSGGGASLVAHHWVDAELGGALVRDGRRGSLVLHDAREWGEEVLRHLPDPAAGGTVGTVGGTAADVDGCCVPMDCWAALAGNAEQTGEQTPDAVAAVARMAGTDPEVVAQVGGWARDVRAVLHVSVPVPPPPDGRGRAPYALVRFLGTRCWWAAQPGHAADGRRTATLRAVGRDEVRTALGALVAEAWALDGSEARDDRGSGA